MGLGNAECKSDSNTHLEVCSSDRTWKTVKLWVRFGSDFMKHAQTARLLQQSLSTDSNRSDRILAKKYLTATVNMTAPYCKLKESAHKGHNFVDLAYQNYDSLTIIFGPIQYSILQSKNNQEKLQKWP